MSLCQPSRLAILVLAAAYQHRTGRRDSGSQQGCRRARAAAAARGGSSAAGDSSAGSGACPPPPHRWSLAASRGPETPKARVPALVLTRVQGDLPAGQCRRVPACLPALRVHVGSQRALRTDARRAVLGGRVNWAADRDGDDAVARMMPAGRWRAGTRSRRQRPRCAGGVHAPGC